MKTKLYNYEGRQMSIFQLHEIATNGITPDALRYRLNVKKMSIHDALTKPVSKKHRPKGVRKMSCGATSPFDCLNCPYKIMPCLREPAMKGEGVGDYVFSDYGRR